jgi:hypothetical protein
MPYGVAVDAAAIVRSNRKRCAELTGTYITAKKNCAPRIDNLISQRVAIEVFKR